MIAHQPKSWWDCVLPKLEDEEEEVWFTHPTENIKCNQIGFLVYDDQEYMMVDLPYKSCYLRKKNPAGKFVISIGTKSNVVWECYNQKTTKTRILHANHNENDYTFDNLHCTVWETPYEKVVRNKKKREWETRSAEILLEKEASMAAKGLDKETYRAFLMLPSWLIDKTDSLI